jgi:hypothetical protein
MYTVYRYYVCRSIEKKKEIQLNIFLKIIFVKVCSVERRWWVQQPPKGTAIYLFTYNARYNDYRMRDNGRR